MPLSQRRQQVALCLFLSVVLTACFPGGWSPAGILSNEVRSVIGPRSVTSQRLDTTAAAKERRTYSANHLTDLPGLLICNESDPDCLAGDADEQAAHRNAGTVYNYFMTVHNRDSYDAAGGIFTSTVHYDSDFNHLFWDGEQMVYGDGDGINFIGMARALDLVGHEWTHAVIDYTANLIHQDQPGALAESVADIFGTMIEFFGDGAHADWFIGEDVYTPAIPGDALRDMADPTQGLYHPDLPYQGPGQPDHMSHYANLPLSYDNGGIHINSGIINKAAYLMAEGGSFHGINVAGIGRDPMAQIWYRALVVYLTPLSDFAAARNATIQAAKDLYGADSAAVKTVQDAFAAVGIGRATSQTKLIHLPLTQHNASRSTPSGIYGRITQDGVPIENVSLTLRRCTTFGSDVFCATEATAVTDAFGEYRFTSIPATTDGQYYYVRYVNANDSSRVAYWFGDEITRYSPGTPRQGGSTEIADIQLQAPANDATVSLPATIRWLRRDAIPADLYQLDFLTPSLEQRGSILGDLVSDSISLTALPAGLALDKPFLWGVSALNGDGVAASYFLRRITFAADTTSLNPSGQIARPLDEAGLDRIHNRWMVSRSMPVFQG